MHPAETNKVITANPAQAGFRITSPPAVLPWTPTCTSFHRFLALIHADVQSSVHNRFEDSGRSHTIALPDTRFLLIGKAEAVLPALIRHQLQDAEDRFLIQDPDVGNPDGSKVLPEGVLERGHVHSQASPQNDGAIES